MASFKTLTVLFCTLAMFLGFALADPKCGKNAWISLRNSRISRDNNPTAWGRISITSGLNANDISWGTMQTAVQDCLFNNEKCYWDQYDYTCTTIPAWNYADWSATLNIHFDCTEVDYTCTQSEWHRT